MRYKATAKLLGESRSKSEIANFFLAPRNHPDMVVEILIARRKSNGLGNDHGGNDVDSFALLTGAPAESDPLRPAAPVHPGKKPASSFRLFFRGLALLLVIMFISCAVATNHAQRPGADEAAIALAEGESGPDIEPIDYAVRSAIDSAWKRIAGEPVPASLAQTFSGKLFAGKWTGLFMLDEQGTLKAVARPETMSTVSDWVERYQRLDQENSTLRQTMEALARARDTQSIYLEIDLNKNRLYVKMASQLLYDFPVVTGKGYTKRTSNRTRRFHTPRGIMKVIEKEVNPLWYPPAWHWTEKGEDPPDRSTPLAGVMGTRRLKLPDGFGIHGTRRGRIRPGKYSHGCVRMNKRDIELVYDLCDVGTEVYVY